MRKLQIVLHKFLKEGQNGQNIYRTENEKSKEYKKMLLTFNKNYNSWVQWHTALTPAMGRYKQVVVSRFDASFV